MGHHTPVCFFHIDKQKLPQDLHIIHTAESSEIWDDGAKYGIWKVTSRNWSYQFGLHAICEELGVLELDFVVAEFAYLYDKDLKAAAAAVEQLLSKISDEIPTLSNSENKDPIWWLHETPFGEKFSPDAFRKAFAEAEASYDVDFEFKGHGGYEDRVIGFYSFLKSLRKALLEAISTDRVFVYYRGRL